MGWVLLVQFEVGTFLLVGRLLLLIQLMTSLRRVYLTTFLFVAR
jgi:hypothetical protein